MTRPIYITTVLTVIATMAFAHYAGLHILAAMPIGILAGALGYYITKAKAMHLSALTYACTNCGEYFKIDDWNELVFVVGHLGKVKLRCPHCNVKNYCFITTF